MYTSVQFFDIFCLHQFASFHFYRTDEERLLLNLIQSLRPILNITVKIILIHCSRLIEEEQLQKPRLLTFANRTTFGGYYDGSREMCTLDGNRTSLYTRNVTKGPAYC